ncbi:MAG: nitrilase-related carbon-nitrogen hydrolase [Planctomycetota bacterium]
MTAPEEYLAAAVQFDVVAGDVDANVAAMHSGIDEAVAAGARLCVLPEMWSTSFLTEFDDALFDAAREADEALRTQSEEHALVVVGSSLEAHGGKVFNTARVYERGELRGSYRKIHLFSPNLEHRHHAAGSEPCVVDTELGRLGVLICYDVRFPELARYYFHSGVEVLVVPGQWPEARGQHWRTLLRARAIENEMFVIGCNRTGQEESLRNGEPMPFPGDGRIIEPTGEILATGNGDAGAVVGPIELRKVRTMRRILPVAADLRPEVYQRLLTEAYDGMVAGTRNETDGQQKDARKAPPKA